MAVVLTSEFTNLAGINYKVEIDDTTAPSPLSNTFNLQSAGFSITYDSETNDIANPISASKCELYCYVNGGYFENTFLANLFDFQYKRYRILIYEDESGSGYTRIWHGFIQQDQVSISEESNPKSITIQAIDGISLLKDIDFNGTNDSLKFNSGTTQISALRILDIMLECVTQIGNNDVFSGLDVYFKSTIATNEIVQNKSGTIASARQAIAGQAIDVRSFEKRNDEGDGYTKTSCYDVIKEIAILYGARFYHADGIYILDQYVQRAKSNYKYFLYTKSGADAGTGTENLNYSVTTSGATLKKARLAGNTDSYLPAVKEVQVTYDPNFYTDQMGFFRWGKFGGALGNTDTYGTSYELGTVSNITETQIALNIKIKANADWPGAISSINAFAYAELFLEIKIEAIDGTTYYYEGRSGNTSRGEWKTTAATTRIVTSVQSSQNTSKFITNDTLRIETQDSIPAIGELSVSVTNPNGLTYGSGAFNDPFSGDYRLVTTAEIELIDGETGTIFNKAENNNTNIDDRYVLNLGTTRIADGGVKTGALVAFDPALNYYVLTTNWVQNSATTGGVPILQLTCENILSLCTKPVEIYDGRLYNYRSAQYTVGWEFKKRILLEGTYTAGSGEWSGRWYTINTDVTNVVGISPRNVFKPIKFDPLANQNPNEIYYGTVGGLFANSDANNGNGGIGPYQVDASGNPVIVNNNDEIIVPSLASSDITIADIESGISGRTIVAAGASGIIQVEAVSIKITSGATGWSSSSVVLQTSISPVVSDTELTSAINTPDNKTFTILNYTANAGDDLILNLAASGAGGDAEFKLFVYYRIL